MGYTGVLVISIILIVIIILVSVLTTSKAYDYKHTVDPIENNPHLDNDDDPHKSEDKQS
ncbi:YtzI protein [Rossellomorea vietnamensis]|uniref:YtzI protein n=1 Tax=Rossellomorea vietnamensis TaxID=218284 RepID=A0A5D4P5E8_9BACI|nr:YtzI protein [Rossellomorea vietnamensis]TYS19902.1 YtzI protein [Rossellomorea vietnamensis]